MVEAHTLLMADRLPTLDANRYHITHPELRLMPVAEFVAHPGAVPHFPAIVAEMLELRP